MKIFKSKLFWIILAIVVILLILYFVGKNKYKNTTTNTSIFPLRKGSHGAEVLEVQKYFNKNNNCGIKEDGFFGADTESCVNDIWKVTEIDENSYVNKIKQNNFVDSVTSATTDLTQEIGSLFSGKSKK